MQFVFRIHFDIIQARCRIHLTCTTKNHPISSWEAQLIKKLFFCCETRKMH
jgi:hypothetical protein